MTHMDMEKSIGLSFLRKMMYTKKFYDERHVKKNMNAKIGREKN